MQSGYNQIQAASQHQMAQLPSSVSAVQVSGEAARQADSPYVAREVNAGRRARADLKERMGRQSQAPPSRCRRSSWRPCLSWWS